MKNDKLTEESRKKWFSVMKNDFMSSEESGEDDSIIIRPLAWRTSYVSNMFKRIDAYCHARKSPQARRQTKQRVNGCTSNRSVPDDYPVWAVNNDQEN